MKLVKFQIGTDTRSDTPIFMTVRADHVIATRRYASADEGGPACFVFIMGLKSDYLIIEKTEEAVWQAVAAALRHGDDCTVNVNTGEVEKFVKFPTSGDPCPDPAIITPIV